MIESSTSANFSSEILKIKLIAAWNLSNKCSGVGPLSFFSNVSNHYVQIDLYSNDDLLVKEKVYISKIKKNTLNPKWNEDILIKVIPTEHKILLSIFNDDGKTMQHHFCGVVKLNLTKIHRENWPNAILTKCYNLQPRDETIVTGELELYHAFLDQSNIEYHNKMSEQKRNTNEENGKNDESENDLYENKMKDEINEYGEIEMKEQNKDNENGKKEESEIVDEISEYEEMEINEHNRNDESENVVGEEEVEECKNSESENIVEENGQKYEMSEFLEMDKEPDQYTRCFVSNCFYLFLFF